MFMVVQTEIYMIYDKVKEVIAISEFKYMTKW